MTDFLSTKDIIYDLMELHSDEVCEHLQGHHNGTAERLITLDYRITDGHNVDIFRKDIEDAISCEQARRIAYLERHK